MPLTVGSRLGHYDVTALIGEGGMGQVYGPLLSHTEDRIISPPIEQPSHRPSLFVCENVRQPGHTIVRHVIGTMAAGLPALTASSSRT